jgi:tRNA A-37 threonylcarbamoyl transferase component Bud32
MRTMSATATLERLGRYRITRVLGQGAMGLVYAARDPLLNRQVAIKTILRSALQDEDLSADASSRFIREAQAIARLTHPHIVTVFDFGEENDVAYIVMEFVQGRELKQCFDAGEFFDLATAIRIMAELLDALDYAHKNGVVHRDVKPANVMLDEAGRVKLTDFGVARLADSNSDRTMAGTMVGTPSYMSPEQIQGLPVGSRTDIFAAGIVLYQFLTHKRPFPGPGQWTVQKQIVSDDPVPPSFADARLGPVFDPIVARALAKDPAQRYASAADFAAELKRALVESAPAAATPVAVSQPSPAQATAERRAAPAADDEATLTDATVPERTAVIDSRPATPTAPPKANIVDPTRSAPPVATPAADTTRPAMSMRLGVAALLLMAALGGTAFLARDPPSPQPPVAGAAAVAPSPSPPAVPDRAEAEKPAAPAAVAVEPDPRPTPAAAKQPAPTLRAAASSQAAEPPKTSRATPAQTAARHSARCEDLLQRFQLGEPLSPDDVTTLQKECKK